MAWSPDSGPGARALRLALDAASPGDLSTALAGRTLPGGCYSQYCRALAALLSSVAPPASAYAAAVGPYVTRARR